MGSFFPCCLPFGKAGELQIRRYQGFAVNDYSFTLDALALNLSDFCNVEEKNDLPPADGLTANPLTAR
jgi:hypothetical protein